MTITGTNFEPGATQVRFNGVAPVVRTVTPTTITTTVPIGATTGPLVVTTSRGAARRLPWGEGASSIRPRIHAEFDDSAVYVQLTGRQDEENLLKLRRDTGDVIWAQQLDRWSTGVPPVWYQGRLLVRSAVEIYPPDGHGHYQAVNPSTGLPVWRIRLESMSDGLDDAPLIAKDRAYLTTEVRPPQYRHFYVVDLQRGRLAENSIVENLHHPIAEMDRVFYLAGQTPGAQYVRYGPDRVLWRATITPSDGLLPSITSTGVVDEAAKRVYLGDTRNSGRGASATSSAAGRRWLAGALRSRRSGRGGLRWSGASPGRGPGTSGG